MALKPQNTHKHLLNFVSKSESRPILTGVNVNDEGHLEATDSHVLLRLHNQFPAGQPMTFNPKTLKVLAGNYPDVNRLIPTKFEHTFDLSYSQILRVFEFAKGLKKDTIHITQKDGALEFRGRESNTTMTLEGISADVNIVLQAVYVKNAFDFIRDNTMTYVTVGYQSSIRPIVFTREKNFDLLITPMRQKIKN